MVSFAHLLTLLCVLVSATLAEEVGAAKTDSVEEKWVSYRFPPGIFNQGWFYNRYSYDWFSLYGNVAAFGVWPYRPQAWFKDVGSSVARRTLAFNSDHLYPRSQSETVPCKAHDGQVVHITPAHCQKAVDKLISNKASSAGCESCQVTLASPTGKLAAAGVPAEALHSAASEVLKACSSGEAAGAAHQNARRSPADANQKSTQQFAMIISKGAGSSCS